MRYSMAKFVFILVLAKIDRLDTKPVEIVYAGQGCECPVNLPYQVNIPVPPPPPNLDCQSYGYKVEVPPPARAQYSYSFDFVVEEPVPPPPKPVCKQNLFAMVDKIVIPKPDCLDAIPAPAPPPPPPLPLVPKPCQYDRTKVCTCGSCSPLPPIYDYQVDVPILPPPSCLCGKCPPAKPQCRYVLSGIETNHIVRSKRDTSSKKHGYKEIRDMVKSLKTPRKGKKAKLVKRDIKGEYDMLEKDRSSLDLTIPEIIQYMPETLSSKFKRGKCNIGCKNCINKQEPESSSPIETTTTDSKQDSQPSEKPAESSTQNTQTLSDQQFSITSPFSGANYLKRSVDPFQYPFPCYPPLMPPAYIGGPPHMATFAQNPGNPIWYQPRPLIDPNGDYVYDRLGHKYEVKNGSLKLVTPQSADEVNVSAPAAPNAKENAQTTTAAAGAQTQGEVNAPIIGDDQMLQATPIVGAPGRHDPSYDPQMDKVIRDIIYQHPDFVDATEHAPGSLTQPQDVQRDETMQFLGKLIRGRLNNWFGINEEAQHQNLQDLNRYSRETGTSIKFIPVVTVDKDKLSKYRQEKTQASS